MNKFFFIILLMVCSLQTIKGQNLQDILIIDSKHEISVPNEKMITSISIKRGLIKETKKKLLEQCVDSTKLYNGNCFKVTFYDDNDFLIVGQGKQNYIKGEIYSLNESEIKNINSKIENYKITKADPNNVGEVTASTDSTKVSYKVNLIFQYGGESKLTILPKVNLLRVHKLNLFNPYYGVELGIHPYLIGGAFTFSGLCGIEKNIFNIESSFSHFRTIKIKNGENSFIGPFSQNSLNLKFGIRIKKIGIKIGTSFLVNENIPQGQEKISVLDIGKINNNTYGIEFLINLK